MKRNKTIRLTFVIAAIMFALSSAILSNKYESPALFGVFIIAIICVLYGVNAIENAKAIEQELSDFTTPLTEEEIYHLDVLEELNY